MSTTEKKSTFLGGTAVLMAGLIIVKIIGAIYKIPLLNVLGDVGYGHFSAAYIIFNLLMTITTAGLPVALSRTIAADDALGRHNQVQKNFRVAFTTFFIMGVVGFAVMFFGAGWLSDLQNTQGARYAIMALAPCVFFVCVMSAFRGYAQGHGNMTPTAVSQIIEAFLKLAVGLSLAAYLVRLSYPREGQNLEMGAAGAIIGVSSGALVGLIYISLWYVRSRRGARRGTDTPEKGKTILARLVKIAIPITIGSSMAAIVSVIDTGQVQGIMKNALLMEEKVADGLYGTYQGCMTLYNLPSSFMVPFTAAVIPAVSAALARRDKLGAGRVAESALRISSLIALPMGIGLCVLAGPIVSLLYPKLDVSVAGPLLSVMGIASIFVCVMLICNAILQANGYENLPIIATVVGGVVKVVVNQLVVTIPSVNIQGAAISTLCCFAAAAILDVVFILRVVPAKPNFFRAFAKPLMASVVMGAAAWAVCGLLSGRIGARLSCVAGVLVGGVIYLFLVILLKVFSKEDLELMPKGDKIAKILRIK